VRTTTFSVSRPVKELPMGNLQSTAKPIADKPQGTVPSRIMTRMQTMMFMGDLLHDW
jgi:hypothetical protein